jgi:hypothetical protein
MNKSPLHIWIASEETYLGSKGTYQPYEIVASGADCSCDGRAYLPLPNSGKKRSGQKRHLIGSFTGEINRAAMKELSTV